MKRIPIDECPAGPEIDVAAGKALGWQVASSGFFRVWLISGGKRMSVNDWKPSTDIAAAWELANLEKMAVIPTDNDLWAALPDEEMTTWEVNDGALEGEYETSLLYPSTDIAETVADTASLAITRAYLKAKGIEFVEVEE